MTDRIEAVRRFSDEVGDEVPIQGWIEGPAAEAADLFGMEDFLMATLMDPDFAGELMDWVVEMETRFALAQVEAGAHLIGMGDAAASLLSPEYYREETAPRERRIVEAIHEAGAAVRLHICGSVEGKFEAMAGTGADILDIDFPQSIASVRKAVGPGVCLSGNVHPTEGVYRGTPEGVRAAFAACHEEAGERYILGAGCEIPPGTPEANLRAMFDYAASVS